jgi:hypothetical protein
MKTISQQKAAPAKPTLKVKPLTPRKDPKGGRRGGDCDEFGCGSNHNEVVVLGGMS